MINRLEETVLAFLLGMMTVVTFVNVVLRYVFNSGILWGLEITLVLFAWLVMFGMSYCLKINAHLGVDLLINRVSDPVRRILGLCASLVCIIYSLLLLKGAWDYWAPFAGLYQTTGRWFPTGIDWGTLDRAWYETDQLPMPEFLRFLETLINQGEEYEKLPRMVPYAVIPVGAALLLLRLVQATLRLWHGSQHSLIASHEADTGSTPEVEG